MIYFTADTHFGHANAVWMCDRPYSYGHQSYFEWAE